MYYPMHATGRPLLDNAHSQTEAPVEGASLPHDKHRPHAPLVRCDNRGCGQYWHWKKTHEYWYYDEPTERHYLCHGCPDRCMPTVLGS